eukprot:5566438-Pleurochrysis_carterae.AAC.2
MAASILVSAFTFWALSLFGFCRRCMSCSSLLHAGFQACRKPFPTVAPFCLTIVRRFECMVYTSPFSLSLPATLSSRPRTLTSPSHSTAARLLALHALFIGPPLLCSPSACWSVTFDRKVQYLRVNVERNTLGSFTSRSHARVDVIDHACIRAGNRHAFEQAAGRACRSRRKLCQTGQTAVASAYLEDMRLVFAVHAVFHVRGRALFVPLEGSESPGARAIGRCSVSSPFACSDHFAPKVPFSKNLSDFLACFQLCIAFAFSHPTSLPPSLRPLKERVDHLSGNP